MTDLPVIPEKYRTRENSRLFWKVQPYYTAIFCNDVSSYRICIVEEYKEMVVVDVVTSKWDEVTPNPKYRWWNGEPKEVVSKCYKRENIEEELLKTETLFDVFISKNLDFTDEDVYAKSLEALESYEKRYNASQLIGEYPPKTLNVKDI